jgi:hypothetical protein
MVRQAHNLTPASRAAPQPGRAPARAAGPSATRASDLLGPWTHDGQDRARVGCRSAPRRTQRRRYALLAPMALRRGSRAGRRQEHAAKSETRTPRSLDQGGAKARITASRRRERATQCTTTTPFFAGCGDAAAKNARAGGGSARHRTQRRPHASKAAARPAPRTLPCLANLRPRPLVEPPPSGAASILLASLRPVSPAPNRKALLHKPPSPPPAPSPLPARLLSSPKHAPGRARIGLPPPRKYQPGVAHPAQDP